MPWISVQTRKNPEVTHAKILVISSFFSGKFSINCLIHSNYRSNSIYLIFIHLKLKYIKDSFCLWRYSFCIMSFDLLVFVVTYLFICGFEIWYLNILLYVSPYFFKRNFHILTTLLYVLLRNTSTNHSIKYSLLLFFFLFMAQNNL